MRRLNLVLIALLCAALLGGGFAASAQEERAATPRTISGLATTFLTGSGTFIAMPDSLDGYDMTNTLTEAGEAVPSCTKGGNIGTNSAWFAINHPGGTLDINTAFGTGSNFDSIIQVFAYDTQAIADLLEIGCDDDGGGGSSLNDARFTAVMASAPYIVRIACLNCPGGVFPTDLALELSFTPPAGSEPVSNIINNMVPITFNRAIKVNNIGFTNLAVDENINVPGGCTMSHTVWYRFVAPRSGHYSFTTYGSRLIRQYESQDTKLAVYSSSGGPSFPGLTMLGCSDDSFGAFYSTLPGLSIAAGTEVYVRVGTFSSSNLLAGSQYRVYVSPEFMSNLGTNGSFNSGTADYTLVGMTGSDGVFNDGGNNVFRIFGAPGKVAKLKQSVNFASLGFDRADEGSAFRVFLTYNSVGTITENTKFILKVTYTNGVLPTKVSSRALRVTDSYVTTNLIALLTSKKVAKVSLTVKNSSIGGQIRVDSIQFDYTGSIVRTRKGDALLPPPPAPAWETRDGVKLRGSN
ncbi:MAG: hypothetical protein IPK52_20020 [Chloroflexi bacterium]|nr:hypothetical protein [Chloroflexota bacterium]